MTPGPLRLSEARAREVSRDLREGKEVSLRRRRGIVGLSLAAAGSMGLIALYQTGLIEHLPEPPLRRLNADEIDAAPAAYRLLATPDALLGLVSYGTTAALAAAGGSDRNRRWPWLAAVLTGKALFDSGQAARLTVRQWREHRSWCFWCLAAAAATVATVPLALGEVRESLR